jgi:hypothetical protein
MTSRVVLHVGTPKSGTTTVQTLLRRHRDAFAAQGVLVAGPRRVDLVHAGLIVRDDPRAARLDAHAATAWARLVAEIGDWSGPTAIVSYELLAAATAEQSARAIAAFGDAEVHVVVTARDLARGVAAAWQERLKFAGTVALEDWRMRADRAEWGWWTLDPAGVLGRWGAGLPAERVHLVTVPADGEDEILWGRFVAACGVDPLPFAVEVPRENRSLGPVAAEVLRRINLALGGAFPTDAERARWLRDVLAGRVLADLAPGPLAITDAQYDDALARGEQAIATLRATGLRVHGDLEDLRATRPVGRMPGEVAEDEVWEVTARAVVRLLTLLRQEADGLSDR